MKKENHIKLLKRSIHCPYVSKLVKDFNRGIDEEFLLTDYILTMSNAIEAIQKAAINLYMTRTADRVLIPKEQLEWLA